ncbi:KHG/KDPG aldolase [Spirochaetia bacterium]|nr:KHG/KDPG aldolase [Spirochaetia bacterium]
MTIQERIHATWLIPVVVLDDAARAVDTAKAMLAGGVDIMEITLRTEAGLASIEAAAKACPEVIVGGGTVLTLDNCKEAIKRGAQFIVSPGFDPLIVDYCLANHIAVFPGCVTPTEITAALNKGLDVVKFFPAQVYGGIKAIKALSGPFSTVRFIPTGGVDLTNIADYVTPSVFAIGGGWLCDRTAVNNGDYAAITRVCTESVAAVKKYRG